MRIEINDYTNPASQAAHLLHDLKSLIDALVKVDPRIINNEQMDGKPMLDILSYQAGRLYTVMLSAGFDRADTA